MRRAQKAEKKSTNNAENKRKEQSKSVANKKKDRIQLPKEKS